MLADNRTVRKWIKRGVVSLLPWGSHRARNDERYNLNQLQRFESVLNRYGWSLRQFRNILDFGCGYGRLTQYLFTLIPEAQVFGSDVSARDITWCRGRYPAGYFVVNDWKPPHPLRANQCDLIFSYSVFTHLSEQNHKEWLKELSRVLKPGGVMIHTTHSYECLRRLVLFSPERLAKYRLGMGMEEFIRSGKGYHYVSDYTPDQEYGLSIISREYVMTTWPQCSGLDLVDYVEGAIEAYPEGCQDMVVLAKSSVGGDDGG